MTTRDTAKPTPDQPALSQPTDDAVTNAFLDHAGNFRAMMHALGTSPIALLAALQRPAVRRFIDELKEQLESTRVIREAMTLGKLADDLSTTFDAVSEPTLRCRIAALLIRSLKPARPPIRRHEAADRAESPRIARHINQPLQDDPASTDHTPTDHAPTDASEKDPAPNSLPATEPAPIQSSKPLPPSVPVPVLSAQLPSIAPPVVLPAAQLEAATRFLNRAARRKALFSAHQSQAQGLAPPPDSDSQSS